MPDPIPAPSDREVETFRGTNWQSSVYPDPTTLRDLESELLRYFRARVPPDTDPRDLLGEVWLALAHYRGKANASVRTFAFDVARLRLANLYRERERRRRRGFELADPPELLVDSRAGPAAELERHYQRMLLYRAIEKLPTAFQGVLVLHLAGIDNFEIAELLGIHYNTVRSRLSRAQAKVRALLEKSRACR